MTSVKEARQTVANAVHALPITRWDDVEAALDEYRDAVRAETEARVRAEIADHFEARAKKWSQAANAAMERGEVAVAENAWPAAGAFAHVADWLRGKA